MNSDPSFRDAYHVVVAAFASQMVVTTSKSTLPMIAPKRAEARNAALVGYHRLDQRNGG